MRRLRWEQGECLLPWVCAGQIRGGLMRAPDRDGHRMRGANRRPDQAGLDGELRAWSLSMRERPSPVCLLPFRGTRLMVYSHAFTRVRVSAAPIFSE